MSEQPNNDIEILDGEKARSLRLLEKSGILLEQALDKALLHLTKGTLEVKEVSRHGAQVNIKVGPVVSIGTVRALYKEVRSMIYRQQLDGMKHLITEAQQNQIALEEVDYSQMSQEELMERIRRLIEE